MALADLEPWLPPEIDPYGELAVELTEDALYAPYLERQEAELKDMRAGASVPLSCLVYSEVPGLSHEMVERLESARPETLADASRIRGITPAALATLLVHARRGADAA